MTNRLTEIMQLGQSIWYDNIRRAMITSGDLKKKIEEDDLRGVTSNPTIFEKAITGSADYDEQLRTLVQAGKGVSEIYEDLVAEDIGNAADVLLPVYERTDGLDGYISLEVNPGLAYKTQETIEEAVRLFKRLGRKNVMIKIPASQEGIPAIEESIYRGVNINITMIFSIENYEQVAEAFIRGLERRAAEGKNVDGIASVASFFVSRVDTAVDTDLEYKARHASTPEEAERLKSLLGRAAVANAKLAYQKFKEIFHGPRFAELKAKGAQVQRCLWASTGTKNPEYSDVLYVDNLIGPETVNTVPPATYTAIRDHGKVALTLEEGLEECRALIGELAEVGIDLKAVTDKLQKDGLEAFVHSLDTLFESIEAKRDALLSGINERTTASLGKYADAVSAAIREAEKGDVMRRVWRKDAALWKDTAEHQKVIKNALGWLNVADAMIGVEDDLIHFADRIRNERGFKYVVLNGMGGSSLAPEVMRRTFGKQEGYPELLVLDSTDPDTVADLRDRVDPEHTLFVVSSKSGTTTEPLMFYRYWYDQVSRVKENPGENFVAVTDPGTKMEADAKRDHFKRIFLNPADIGGRYSALSYFGVVPAALMGVDIKKLLDRAERTMHACSQVVPAGENPAARLGAIIGECAKAGRDKLTIIADSRVESFGLWVEQLIAESTGKEGKGIVPVAGEPLGAPSVYGDDRLFVSIAVGKLDSETESKLKALEAAGHPVVYRTLHDTYDLGEEFFLWELATAFAGWRLGINPFDQPNVQESKDATKELLDYFKEHGTLQEQTAHASDGTLTVYADDATRAELPAASVADAIKAHLRRAGAGDYIALLDYLEETDENEAVIQKIRTHLRDATRCATTTGYGPRFLHSTGQLHKGGPASGVFMQLTAGDARDVEIPDEPFTFSTLKQAQALGDFRSLSTRGRRAVRVELGADATAGLKRLYEIVREALPVSGATGRSEMTTPEQTTKTAQVGMIGLAVMGENLARNIERNGYTVAVYNRPPSREEPDRVTKFMEEYGDKRFVGTRTPEEFVKSLERPRKIILLVKAGDPVDWTVEQIKPYLEAGDIVIDGGNSYFLDTARREQQLKSEGFNFIGSGVSGGEKGALEGPSLMPGGDRDAYEQIRPIWEAIAAKVDDGPCVTYIGPGGAGHFVKMVHNGIEYGDMQLIAEAYDLMRRVLGMSAREMAEVFDEWNRGDLESYLIEITAKILRVEDPETGRPLVDMILDKAGQKGTGKWTSEIALELGIPIPTINAAVDSRNLSARKDERVEASREISGPSGTSFGGDRGEMIAAIRDALYASKICSYAQGMNLIRAGSEHYEWGINLGETARIWKGGCIIRARFLGKIKDAYSRRAELPNLLLDPDFNAYMQGAQANWRRVVATAAQAGIPVPAFSASLGYFDAYRTADLPLNLTQAQRDFFGSHTYQRADRPEAGFVHTEWEELLEQQEK